MLCRIDPLARKQAILADTHSALSHFIAGQLHFYALANREVTTSRNSRAGNIAPHRYCREDPNGGRLSQRTATRLVIFDPSTIESQVSF
jgi:hypothetical protein